MGTVTSEGWLSHACLALPGPPLEPRGGFRSEFRVSHADLSLSGIGARKDAEVAGGTSAWEHHLQFPGLHCSHVLSELRDKGI